MRWTGSSGQIELHQPLLPLNTIPPIIAPTSEPPISAAVATPLVFNSGWREATKRMNATMPTTGAYSRNQSGGVRPRVNLNRRGVWLEAASGQRLRHSPGAVSHSNGSSGIASFHHSFRPVCLSTISSTHSVIAAPTLSTRPACQSHIGIRRLTCV